MEPICYFVNDKVFIHLLLFNLGESSKLGKHLVMQFIKQYNVKIRVKQRNKKRPREAFRENLQKWHATTTERLLRTGFHDNYHLKWGRFITKQRISVDQSPLPFVLDMKRTYDHYEKGKGHKHNTWISTPDEGLTRRQCSLQISVTPEGQQP